MKSQTPKRIKSTSQATLHTNPGGDNRWRPEVRFFAKTAKRIKSTSPGRTKKQKNESSLQARAPPPKPKRAPGSIRERSERVRYRVSSPYCLGGGALGKYPRKGRWPRIWKFHTITSLSRQEISFLRRYSLKKRPYPLKKERPVQRGMGNTIQ